MNYNLEITQQEKEILSLDDITAIPEDREELITLYSFRFLPMAFDEWENYTEIETMESVGELIKKYDIREQAQGAKGNKEKEANVLRSLCGNKALREEQLTHLEDYAKRKATEFVTSKRNRLRAKALLLMGEERLNEKELAYLRGEGEFWYNETEEESVC
jgi:hypothetical protein